MKHTKYIAFLSVLFFAACTTELIEPSYDLNGNNKVQLVSRVVPFSDRDVATRANKNDAETKISSIDYFIFDASDICVFHDRVLSTEPLLVDKSSSDFKDVNLSECYIVSIANGPQLNVEEKTTTWNQVSSQSIDVTGVTIQENVGLPMVGRYPETGTFDFGGTNQGTVLTVPMKSLFSKIVFNISVDSDEIRPGENQPLPTFTLTGCTVHNVASEVDFIGGAESQPGLADGTDDETSVNENGYSVLASGETVDGGASLSFSLYLPERFLTAGIASSLFTYPFNRDEEKEYRQHYKPLLAKGYEAYNSSYDEEKDKKATFVRLKGEYSNHQGHSYDVSYDIYVGNDNYGNFDIVRNTQYNNNVIIRGINNSNSQSPDLGSVSIDHRVNVERSAPIIINLRRETLLDSHFEVRPLLIRKNGKFDPETDLSNAKVKVEVVYNDGELPDGKTIKNWIGLERSFGNGDIQTATNATYLVDKDLAVGRKNAAGKRKFFTTDLTTNTLNTPGVFDDNGLSEAGGTTVVVPITDADQRVWIYIDECTAIGDGVRSARINISYDLDGNGEGYSDPIEYVLNQRLLYPVTYNSHTYQIEYHEEYLYNYDSDDQYGQTYYEGMKWGLDGAQLSFDELSLAFGSALADYFTGDLKPYYDFYVKKHDSAATGKLWEYSGSDFMTNIIKDVNVKNNPNRQTGIDEVIDILDLSTDPSSAIEYCLNKNKRNSDGHVIWQNEDGTWNTDNLKWYLPAIDEIEDIVMGGYSEFLVFQNNYYWSCQPSYIRNYAYYDGPLTSLFGGGAKHGPYYIDDKNYARATKVSYLGNDIYSYENSGVESGNYYNGWYHYEFGFFEIDDIVRSGSWNNGINTTLGTINREPGNQPRSKRNRIRCVHKSN